MGLLSRLLGAVGSPRSSSDWDRICHETKWDFVEETSRGVKLRKKLAEKYQHMETGEEAVYYRKDTRIEWHHWENHEDWPEYVDIAMDEGECWDSDFDDGELYGLWGHIMGGGTWKRER